MPIAFYHGDGSRFSWRVHLALEHLGVAYHLHRTALGAAGTRSEGFLALHPRGQIPALVDGGLALAESVVILEYLDDRYGASAPRGPLYGRGACERARVRGFVREAEEYLGRAGVDPLVEELLLRTGGRADLPRIQRARERVAEELAGLALRIRGRFIFGSSPGAADFVLYPYVAYIRRLHGIAPAARLLAAIPASVEAWEARVRELPYFARTLPVSWRSQ
jgi:glutathione S-transferase